MRARAARGRAGTARLAGLLLLVLASAGACATGAGDEAPTSDGTVTTEPGAEPTGTPSPTTTSSAPSAGADLTGTSLTIALDEQGDGAPTTSTLTCDPPGGDHADPEAACDALAAAGGVAAFAPPQDDMCTEQYGGPQVATVEGTVAGERVTARFSRTNGCEISRWDALAPLLGSPGGGL